MSNPSENLAKLKSRLAAETALIGKAFEAKEWRYKSLQGLVLAHGRAFLDKSPEAIRQGRIKACYENCYKMAIADESLTYCEGYAWSNESLFLVPHAWLLDREGRVIEPTPIWSERAAHAAYFGIPFALEYVCDMVERNKEYGILENAYRLGDQISQEGFPASALRQPDR